MHGNFLPPGSPIRKYSTCRDVWCQNEDTIASIMLCLHYVQKYIQLCVIRGNAYWHNNSKTGSFRLWYAGTSSIVAANTMTIAIVQVRFLSLWIGGLRRGEWSASHPGRLQWGEGGRNLGTLYTYIWSRVWPGGSLHAYDKRETSYRCWELNPSNSEARSLIAIPTELPWL